MNELRCEQVQDRMPDLVRGAVEGPEADALRAHVETCAECAETLALVALLREGRPAAPAELAVRVEGALRRRREAMPTRPWWGLAAAAVAALALGIGVTSERATAPDVPSFVAEAQAPSSWLADDGLVAGAPALGDLSEEALLTLLEEMGGSPSGGAA